MVFDPATPGTLNATIEDTIKICPEGTWTQDLGATDPDQCSEWRLHRAQCAVLSM
jgi:hypothetical protein